MNYYCVPLSNKVPLFVGFERHSASNPELGRLQDRQKQCENGQAGRRLSVAAVMHWILLYVEKSRCQHHYMNTLASLSSSSPDSSKCC